MLTVLMSKPLLDVRIICRPVTTTVVPEVSLLGPERTAEIRREHNSNRSNVAAQYIPGVETLPG